MPVELRTSIDELKGSLAIERDNRFIERVKEAKGFSLQEMRKVREMAPQKLVINESLSLIT